MWKIIKQHKDWLFILIGLALIITAAYQLKDVYPFSQIKTLWEKPVIDQEGFASILVPEGNSAVIDYVQDPAIEADIPDRIIIDVMGLDAPVLVSKSIKANVDGKEVIQFLVPEEFAAGWHEASAPLGVIGNTVISGHHNAYGKVFEKLVDLRIDDEVMLMSGEKEFRYKVVKKLNLPEKDEPIEVRLKNAQWIFPSDDERITLVTCWPKFSNTNRIIIVAVPIEIEDN